MVNSLTDVVGRTSDLEQRLLQEHTVIGKDAPYVLLERSYPLCHSYNTKKPPAHAGGFSTVLPLQSLQGDKKRLFTEMA